MQQNNRKPTKFWLFLTALVVIIAIFGYSPIRNSFFRPFEYITTPIVHISYSIGQWLHRLPHPLQQKKDLLSKNEKLQQENEKLLQENSALRALQEEAAITKRMQEFMDSISARGITAHVIGKSSSEKKILIIDRGKDHGIIKGAAAITESGIIIGTVDNVQARSSHILLITDSSQNIAAKIQNDSSSPGVIKGEFGLALSMELIPQNDHVEAQQTVVTSALDSKIPPNLLIGTITDVDKKEGSVFQNAKVVSPIQLDRVETISVITPADESI